MKPLTYRDVERRLFAAGFAMVGQQGSHVKFAKMTAQGRRTAIVPRHREIATGTQRGILRQAGLSPDEFDDLG